MSQEGLIYRTLEKDPYGMHGRDKLFCMHCNMIMLRSSFPTHKKSPKHIKNLPDIYKSQIEQPKKQISKYTKNKNIIISDNEEEDEEKEEIKIEKIEHKQVEEQEESESDDDKIPEFIDINDCSTNTLCMMRIKKNALTAKMPKYWNAEEKHDYSIIEKILSNQKAKYDDFNNMYKRLSQYNNM